MIHRFTIADTAKGVRLDNYLAETIDELSKSAIRKIIDLGGVHIDGKRVRKCGRQMVLGEKVELHHDNQPLEPFRIAPEHIVFQDKHLIVLNKPAGIECQPTPSRYKGTLYEALQIWLDRDTRFGRKLHIGMSQRLDRNTSGLIVFSIHPNSHKGLSHQIQQRSMGKHYLALVEHRPDPPQGTIRSFLAKQRRSNVMKSVQQGGREAITHYRVLTSSSRLSLVAVRLETGRTHQIRVHFSEAGCPLAGDIKYGGTRSIAGITFNRQCLHSWKIDMLHPVTSAPLHFTAPIPDDMALQELDAAGEVHPPLHTLKPGDIII
ncbi:RluA family pseudouridine synthase [Desulforhopalus singaporensis]|uniref:Pseudouridine synthase n=1 Tax=Desulforhopalus singaporensis TaxID=91360 RepID=A0A1H0TYT4_9BACT|nr:RluA family pseudouridine synthase [Desulforhopalus singaporensis]SDP59222.1 23S rRNA pseudouridine1911/1915/1917 synthase [Desulforhopalus singaporensis]